MAPVSNYLRYLLNHLLRSMWRRGVSEFKSGVLSHDESQKRRGLSHFQKQGTVKKGWEAQFVRFCRASGLAIRQTAKELRAGKRFSERSTTYICPKCGRTYEGGWAKFCVEDGTKLVKWDA